MFFFSVLASLGAQNLTAYADSDHVVIREDASCHNVAPALRYINSTDASIASPSDARILLDQLKATTSTDAKVGPPLRLVEDMLNCDSSQAPAPLGAAAVSPDFDAKDFYALIHVLSWKNPDASNTSKPVAVDKQNWYVYHAGKAWRMEDFGSRNRIFGSHNVWLLFVQLNAQSSYKYEIRYDIELKDVIPAPLNDALQLVNLVAGSAKQAAPIKQDYWGMYPITVLHLPNEMTVQSTIYGPDSENKPSLQKVSTTPPVFVNEGRYHYDFGVAVPVKGISQTTVNTTLDTITPKTTTTANAFAVVDLYPWANDIRNTPFSYYPYFIGGVATASQPLHKLLFAIGWGPAFTQLYVGALLVKQQSVNSSSKATNSSYEPQFTVGINMSARAFNGLLKKTTK